MNGLFLENLIIIVAAVLAALFISFAYVIKWNAVIREIRYLNIEINRCSASERLQLKKRRRRLIFSLISPF